MKEEICTVLVLLTWNKAIELNQGFLSKYTMVCDNDAWLMFGILLPTIDDQQGWNEYYPDDTIDLFHWLFDEILI